MTAAPPPLDERTVDIPDGRAFVSELSVRGSAACLGSNGSPGLLASLDSITSKWGDLLFRRVPRCPACTKEQ